MLLARGLLSFLNANGGPRRGRFALGAMNSPLASFASNASLSRNARLSEPLNYARFFVGELLPPEAERVVYLDADVVVRRSLAALDGAAAAAFAANASALIAAVPRDFKRVCDHLVHCGAPEVAARFDDAKNDLHASRRRAERKDETKKERRKERTAERNAALASIVDASLL